MRTALVLALSLAASAAEPAAPASQILVAGPDGPALFTLHVLPSSTVTLAAGGCVRFSTSPDGKILLADLDRGAAQFSIGGLGTYAGLVVRGAACEVTVTGTLFNMERTGEDADYLAMIHGRVKVKLKEALAKALNQPHEVDISDRTGLAMNAKSGFGKTEALRNRPQVDGPQGKWVPLHDQAMAEILGPGWDADPVAARALTDGTVVVASRGERDVVPELEGERLALDRGKPPAVLVEAMVAGLEANTAQVLEEQHDVITAEILDAVIPVAPGRLADFPPTP